MFSSGARRIMRSFHLDQTSIRFLDQQMVQQMSQIRGVSEQLSILMDGRDSSVVGDRWFAENGITNLTVFRHYLTAAGAARRY